MGALESILRDVRWARLLDERSAAAVRQTCRRGYDIATEAADFRATFAKHTLVLPLAVRRDTAWYCLKYACRWVVPMLAAHLARPIIYEGTLLWVPGPNQVVRVRIQSGPIVCQGTITVSHDGELRMWNVSEDEPLESTFLLGVGTGSSTTPYSDCAWQTNIARMNRYFRAGSDRLEFAVWFAPDPDPDLNFGQNADQNFFVTDERPCKMHTDIGAVPATLSWRGEKRVSVQGSLTVPHVRQYMLCT